MINFNSHNVKIQDGCSQKCSYCIVRNFRGPSVCFSYDEICEEIRFLKRESSNYNNTIKLTGINCTEYYHASVGNLVDLCKKLLKDFPKTYFILDNINPFNIKLLFDLIDLISGEEYMIKDLFVPIQSASDAILKQMYRPYSADVIKKIFDYGVSKNINMITEIIVGFPGETNEDFMETYDFLNRYKARFCTHVFSKRPGTVASELPNQVPEAEVLLRQKAYAQLREENERSHEE